MAGQRKNCDELRHPLMTWLRLRGWPPAKIA
ncbi:integrase [Corchorus olitorius]|uniref:Integrase n=1 Tax=Corchorus olitorius TaxID=93759 RepID=A0A1R3G0I4_9ROSI|nr:integrase [Corchorus olitorius]